MAQKKKKHLDNAEVIEAYGRAFEKWQWLIYLIISIIFSTIDKFIIL